MLLIFKSWSTKHVLDRCCVKTRAHILARTGCLISFKRLILKTRFPTYIEGQQWWCVKDKNASRSRFPSILETYFKSKFTRRCITTVWWLTKVLNEEGKPTVISGWKQEPVKHSIIILTASSFHFSRISREKATSVAETFVMGRCNSQTLLTAPVLTFQCSKWG